MLLGSISHGRVTKVEGISHMLRAYGRKTVYSNGCEVRTEIREDLKEEMAFELSDTLKASKSRELVQSNIF